ncbi:MAG: hypothetical protein ACE5I1_01825 [bacterium]
MQDEYQSTISEAKRNAGTPVYLFAGLVVFPLLIAAMLFFEAKETTEYFANPQINDLYVVESVEQETEYPYLILKLFEVEPDSLAFHMGRYAYQSGYDAESAINGSKIYDSEYFASEELKIAKNEIDLEQIDRIIRPGKDFSRFVDN